MVDPGSLFAVSHCVLGAIEAARQRIALERHPFDQHDLRIAFGQVIGSFHNILDLYPHHYCSNGGADCEDDCDTPVARWQDEAGREKPDVLALVDLATEYWERRQQ